MLAGLFFLFKESFILLTLNLFCVKIWYRRTDRPLVLRTWGEHYCSRPLLFDYDTRRTSTQAALPIEYLKFPRKSTHEKVTFFRSRVDFFCFFPLLFINFEDFMEKFGFAKKFFLNFSVLFGNFQLFSAYFRSLATKKSARLSKTPAKKTVSNMSITAHL